MVFVSGRTPVGTWPKWTGCWDSTETIQMIKLKPWPWSDTWSITICFTSHQCKMIGIHLHILWWFDVTFQGTKFASRLFTWWNTLHKINSLPFSSFSSPASDLSWIFFCSPIFVLHFVFCLFRLFCLFVICLSVHTSSGRTWRSRSLSFRHSGWAGPMVSAVLQLRPPPCTPATWKLAQDQVWRNRCLPILV